MVFKIKNNIFIKMKIKIKLKIIYYFYFYIFNFFYKYSKYKYFILFFNLYILFTNKFEINYIFYKN